MSIAVGTTVKGEVSDAASITLGSVNCSASDCLFVAHGSSSGGGGATVTNVTFNGSATGLSEEWDLVFSTLFSVSGSYILAPALTTANVVISLSGAQDEVIGGATPLSGVDQNTPVRTAVTADGDSTTASVSGIAAAAGDLVLGSVYAQTGTSPAAQSPSSAVWTEDHSGGTGGGVAQRDGASPNVSMTWTLADATWGCGAVAFIPVIVADVIYRPIPHSQRMI